MTLFFLYQLIFPLRYYTSYIKVQYREAVEYIVENDARYSPSLIVGYFWNEWMYDYYFEQKGSSRCIDVRLTVPEDFAQLGEEARIHTPGYIWLIRGHLDGYSDFVELLQKHLTLLEHRPYVNADVWLFEVPHP